MSNSVFPLAGVMIKHVNNHTYLFEKPSADL